VITYHAWSHSGQTYRTVRVPLDIWTELTTRGLWTGIAELTPDQIGLQEWRPHKEPANLGRWRSKSA
jgi:hypothetical protein